MNRTSNQPKKSFVEILEPRVLLSAATAGTQYSTNWSGYSVVETAKNSVSNVSGSWTVPSVSGTGAKYSSDWVGIDGYTSNTVEQLGTESDTTKASSVDGTPQYYAWFEMYPAYPWIIPQTVKPGDNITSSVQFIGSSYTNYTATGNASTDVYTSNTTKTTSTLNDNFVLTISDTTEGWSFNITQSIAGQKDQRTSAEWIVEAPSTNSGPLPLANFKSVTFTNAKATINGNTTGIGANPAATFNSKGKLITSGWAAVDMRNSARKILDSTSALDSAGTSFTVAYGSTTPAAPAVVFSNSLVNASKLGDSWIESSSSVLG